MTNRLELDRYLTDWLLDTAPARAPEHALTGVLARVAEIDQDRHLSQRVFGDRAGRSARLRWGLVLALIAIGLVGAIAVGSALVRRPPLRAGLPSNGAVAFSMGGDIYIAREGEAPRLVIGHDGDGIDQTCPAFSPDGASLAYLETPSNTEGEAPWNVVVTGAAAAADHSALRIATGPASCPIWAPDGRRIAVYGYGDSLVTILDLDGSRTVRFARHESGPGDSPFGTRQDARFAWSPDGSALALVLGYFPGTSEVWIVPAETGEPRRIAAGRPDLEIFRSIAWSPDGSRVVFWGGTGFSSPDPVTPPAPTDFVRLVLADGSAAPVEIDTWTESEQRSSSGPAWSPDGRRIAYVRNGEIVLASSDGSSSRRLPPVRTGDHGNTDWSALADGTWWPGAVSWSPDGRRLLSLGSDVPFLERGVRSSIVSVDVDGVEAPVILTPWRLVWYADRTPTWQPVFEGVPAWDEAARGLNDRGSLVGRTPDPAAADQTPTPPPVPAPE